MALRNIFVRFETNAAGFASQIFAAGSAMQRFSGKAMQASRVTGAWSKGMINAKAATALTVATVGALAGKMAFEAVQAAAKFETALRNVATVSKSARQDFEGTADAVLELSTRLPQSANVLAEALYEISSSGFDGADAFRVLEASAKAGSAGLTTADIAAKGISATLNAYGLAAINARHVSDVLFKTVELGVIRFDELSEQLGDFITSGAQAGIKIEDLGSAIATMTLAGIPAAQAATSLNRVIQAIIEPSDALANRFKRLGYESGQAALDNLGLHGVMKALFADTTGGTQVVLEYFDEIRAARGVLALTAAEFRNYDRIQGEFNDKAAIAGSTQRALKEQMKGFNFQLTLARNAISRVGIELGLKLLPFMKDLLRIALDLGRNLGQLAQEIANRLRPGFASLREVAEDVGVIFQHILDVAKPLAMLFAVLVGAPVILAFNVLADAVSRVTDFLATHKEIVQTIAVLYGTRYVSALVAARIAQSSMSGGIRHIGDLLKGGIALIGRARTAWLAYTVSIQAATVASGAGGIAGALVGAKAAIGGLVTGLASIARVAGPIGILVGTLFTFNRSLDNAKSGAKDLIDELRRAGEFDPGALSKGFNPKDFKTLEEQYTRTATILNQANENAPSGFFDRLGAGVTGLVETLTPLESSVLNNAAALDALSDEEKKLYEDFNNTASGLDEIAVRYGVTEKEAMSLAQSLRLDLTKGAELSDKQILKLDERLALLSTNLGGGVESVANFAEMSEEELMALVEAAKEFRDEVGKAFAESFDVVANFDEFAASVADFTGGARGTIEQFYDDALADANKFTSDLNLAAQAGFDPQLLARIMTAGPKEGQPVLDELVAAAARGHVEMVNSAERELARLNGYVVEQARLTHIATTTESSKIADDWQLAMDIAAVRARLGAGVTARGVADELDRNIVDVRRAANEYGIALVDAASPVAIAVNGQVVNLEQGPVDFFRNANPQGQRAMGSLDLPYGGGAGMKEKHLAQIARAGEWRVWAEDETGGEAYIPLANDFRRPRAESILKNVAGRFGLEIRDLAASNARDYAVGGIEIPFPPDMGGIQGYPLEGQSESSMGTWYKGVERHLMNLQAFIGASFANIGGPIGSVGDIVAFGRRLQALGFSVGEHPFFGGVAPVHVPNSYHYRGRAIDVNWYPASEETAKLNALVAQVRREGIRFVELLWQTEGHFDHAHFALNEGGVRLPYNVFDQGGLLPPGLSLAGNFTGRYEHVASGGSSLNIEAGAIQVKVDVGDGADIPKVKAAVEDAMNESLGQLERMLDRGING